MKEVFLGIGTNLGDREKNLKESITAIEEKIGKVVILSSVYSTEPWGFTTEDEFLNMVVKVETDLIPLELIKRILIIESLSGRVRTENKYLSRVIDIDILFYEDLVISDKNLTIPHPLIQMRKFVLVPLCEIEPELVHPVLKKSIASLMELCEDRSMVKKY
jgi:2-amino-4-hydroxy-6-hydroxymethyldihydropteridine diphosphokinase